MSFPNVDLARAATLQPSRLRGGALSFMVNVVAGVGFILFGYDQGILSGVLDLPGFLETFPETVGGFEGSQSAVLQSWLISSYLVGCFFGALANLYVGDKIGRKWTIMVGGIGVIVGTALQCGSINYGMMVFARIFNGVFNGMITSTVPTYQSECVSAERRGPMLSISGALIGLGLACAYWVNVGFFFAVGEQIRWRVPLALQCVFTFSMLGLFVFYKLPESPRWLASKGRHEESIAVLACLQGTTVDDPEVTQTWHAIVDSLAQSVGDFSMKEIFTHGKSQHFRRTLLGVLSQAFQQMAGINLIVYYLSSVLGLMGMSPLLSRVLSGVAGMVFFLSALIAVAIIERVGRRPLLIWGTVGLGVTMCVLAGLYNLAREGNNAAQVVSVLMVHLYLFFFGATWLPIPWLYPAEITPLRIRAPANALSTASNWLFNFVVVMITGPMFANIGLGTYAFFAAFNFVIILPVVIWWFPETKKLSLEDLDLIFAIAYEEKIRAVTVSTKERHRIPHAGSPEAEAILGRAIPGATAGSSAAVEMKRPVMDVEAGKPGSTHTENVSDPTTSR